jgi:hypothetical protein
MEHSRTFFLPAAVVFFLVFTCTTAWAGEKIQVVKYGLKAVESVDSGRYIKTEWSAKIRNGASEQVNFEITIAFVDSNNEVLKEASSQCELEPHQTKTFTDTVLLDADVAGKVASTKVSIDENAN